MPTTTPTESPDPPGAPPPLPAVVADDLACLRCGYNLRTLPSSSVCPECGEPVAATLARALRLGDPPWVRTLLRRAGWVCAATLALTLTVLLVISYRAHAQSYGSVYAGRRAVLAVAALITPLAWAISVWRFTAIRTEPLEPAAHRRVRRWLAISAASAIFVTAILIVSLTPRRWGTDHLFAVRLLAFVAWSSQLAQAARLRDLFGLLAAPGLARQAGWTLRIQGVALAILIVLWLGPMAISVVESIPLDAGLIAGPAWTPVLNVVFAGCFAALPLAALWTFFLLVALRRHLRLALLGRSAGDAAADSGPAAGARSAALLAAATRYLPLAVGVALVVLNTLPTEVDLGILIADAGPGPFIESTWGWPMVYSVTSPWTVGPPTGFSREAALVNLLVAVILVGMAEALRRDFAHRRCAKL